LELFFPVFAMNLLAVLSERIILGFIDGVDERGH